MDFEIVGPITNVEIIAVGSSIRILPYLRKTYGSGPLAQAQGCCFRSLTKRRFAQSRTALVRSSWHRKAGYQDQTILGRLMIPTKPFVLCLENTNYEASLIVGKIYPVIRDKQAAKDDLVRIVDETGEEYLFHKDHFVFVDFPRAVKSKILSLQSSR